MTDFVSLVAGAGISLTTASVLEYFRFQTKKREAERDRQAQLKTRWDALVAETANTVMASVWGLLHSAGASSPATAAEIDKQHEAFRVALAPLRVFGGSAVQRAARDLLRQGYAVAQVAWGEPDPRPDDPRGEPIERLLATTEVLQLEVRRQLQVAEADQIETEEEFAQWYRASVVDTQTATTEP